MSTPNSQETSWMLIHRAVEGNVDARNEFVRRYEPAARRYLGARWNGTPYIQQLEDAVQQVFLECFRDGSALPCVDGERRFSGFLRGVVNRVAQEFETGKARLSNRQAVPVDEMSASRAFDRAYAKDEMRRAHELLMAHARENGERHVRRVDLLRLPVVDGTLIRNLAAQGGRRGEASELGVREGPRGVQVRLARSAAVARAMPGKQDRGGDPPHPGSGAVVRAGDCGLALDPA